MKYIQLTQGKQAVIDDRDYEYLSSWKWCAHSPKPGKWYAVRSQTIGFMKRIQIKMHRLILSAPNGIHVDHINGNGLDNRRDNIRLCNNTQNNYNSRKQSRITTSNFKGVSFDRESRKWSAHITIVGKRVRIGRFVSEVEAARAYDAEARRLYGEFARTNF